MNVSSTIMRKQTSHRERAYPTSWSKKKDIHAFLNSRESNSQSKLLDFLVSNKLILKKSCSEPLLFFIIFLSSPSLLNSVPHFPFQCDFFNDQEHYQLHFLFLQEINYFSPSTFYLETCFHENSQIFYTSNPDPKLFEIYQGLSVHSMLFTHKCIPLLSLQSFMQQ